MKQKLNPIVKNMIKDANGKRLSRIYITGKGWYSWNTVYHVYNRTTNYEQLRKVDLANLSTNPQL